MRKKRSDDSQVGLACRSAVKFYLNRNEQWGEKLYQDEKQWLREHILQNVRCLPYLQHLLSLLEQDKIFELADCLMGVLNYKKSQLTPAHIYAILRRCKRLEPVFKNEKIIDLT